MRNIVLIFLFAASLQGCFPVILVGAGAGVLMVQDRRTNGAYIEDEAIENKALNRIDIQFKDSVHVNVTSYNRAVLITGQVPSFEVKEQIKRIVANVMNVNKIYNELAVAEKTSLSSRSNDALISSNVKMRFVGDNRFGANSIKVVTENGIVYLMGIVSHAEGHAASSVASGSQGVSRVIEFFEYVD